MRTMVLTISNPEQKNALGPEIYVAGIEALRQLGVLDDATVSSLASHARPQLKNVAGRVVGEARPAFTLAFATES